MMQAIIDFFQVEFGTKAAVLGVLTFLAVVALCAYKRTWPDLNAFVLVYLGTSGTFIALKIVVLAVALPTDTLGILSADKPVLLLGGVISFLVSLKAAATSWHLIVRSPHKAPPET